jgi:hypothetical protein
MMEERPYTCLEMLYGAAIIVAVCVSLTKRFATDSTALRVARASVAMPIVVHHPYAIIPLSSRSRNGHRWSFLLAIGLSSSELMNDVVIRHKSETISRPLDRNVFTSPFHQTINKHCVYGRQENFSPDPKK